MLWSIWNGRWQKLFGRCQKKTGKFLWRDFPWWDLNQNPLRALSCRSETPSPTSRLVFTTFPSAPHFSSISMTQGWSTFPLHRDFYLVRPVCLFVPTWWYWRAGRGRWRPIQRLGWQSDGPAHETLEASVNSITLSLQWWHPVSIKLVWFPNYWIWIWMSLPGASGLGNQVSWWW